MTGKHESHSDTKNLVTTAIVDDMLTLLSLFYRYVFILQSEIDLLEGGRRFISKLNL